MPAPPPGSEDAAFSAAGRLRGRPGLPIVAGAVVLAATLAVAIAKPWGDAPVPSEAPSPTAPVVAVAPTPGPDRRLPRPNAIDRALEVHDEWGVRLLVESRARDGVLEELWQAAAPRTIGSIPSLSGPTDDAAVFRTGGRPVRLMALTIPADVRPPLVRVIVGRPLGRVQIVPVREVVILRGGDAVRLFAPAPRGLWEPGVYQLRFELGDRATAITIAIFAVGPDDPASG